MPTPISIRPIYEDEPARGEAMHDDLSAVHEGVVANNNAGALALNLTARVGDWDISLGSSAAGELDSASMTRLGQETYSFRHTGDKSWGAVGDRAHLFEGAHFYNLVTMATRAGLAWTSTPRLS